MRINKYIAECGYASRRAADQLIKDGKVKVNGKLIAELGMDVDETRDTVTVDGEKLEPVGRYIYIMLNKPKGCVCTVDDDKGRKTIMDYVDITRERVFPVGRLDYDTEGLLLLTNDGALTHKLTHPSHEVGKSYVVKITSEVPENDLALMRNGMDIGEGDKTGRAKVKLLGIEDGIYRYELTIYEGKNRQVRRMFEKVGKEVLFLKRVAVGELRLGGLARGKCRFLTDKEVSYLRVM